MKKLIFITVLALFSTWMFGQDIITKKDGTELKVKVMEVGVKEIKYKKFENLEGPVYAINKTDVFMIKYENGEKDIIKVEEEEPVPPRVTSKPEQKISISASDVQRTRTSGIIGYIMAAPIAGLGTAAALSDDFEVGGILGGAATLSLGISAPILAARARKTRELTGVEGVYTARLTGWILYGVALADAIAALGLNSFEVEIPNATVIGLAVLGATSSVLFGVDAMRTAEQAEQFVASSSIVPTMTITRGAFGQQFTSIGFQINF